MNLQTHQRESDQRVNKVNPINTFLRFFGAKPAMALFAMLYAGASYHAAASFHFPEKETSLANLQSDTQTFTLVWSDVAEAEVFRLEERIKGESEWVHIEPAQRLSHTLEKPINQYEYRVIGCVIDPAQPGSPLCEQVADYSQTLDVDLNVQLPDADIEFAPQPSLSALPGRDAESSRVGTTAGHFRVDESGAATYSVPLTLPEGIAGVTPSVSLEYSSSTGNGHLGIGWSIGGLSAISRCRQTFEQDGRDLHLTLTNHDRFCLDGQKLIPISGSNGENLTEYRTEIDTRTRITSYGNLGGGPLYFIVEREDGSISYYGGQDVTGARIDSYQTSNGVGMAWRLASITDNFANATNAIIFNYANGPGENETLISSIDYSGNRVDFAYADELNSSFSRADATSGFLFGENVELTTRLDQIVVSNHQQVTLRTYNLNYQQDANIGTERLESLQECGLANVCLPATEFAWYPQPTPSFTFANTHTLTDGDEVAAPTPVDIDGDGYTDLVYAKRTSGDFFRVYVAYNNRGALGGAASLFSVRVNAQTNPRPRIVPADIDGDSFVELAFTTYENNERRWKIYDFDDVTLTEVRVCEDWHCENEQVESRIRDMNVDEPSLLLHDVNADARPDILLKDGIRINDGTGSFGAKQAIPTTGQNYYSNFQQNTGRSEAFSYALASANGKDKKEKAPKGPKPKDDPDYGDYIETLFASDVAAKYPGAVNGKKWKEKKDKDKKDKKDKKDDKGAQFGFAAASASVTNEPIVSQVDSILHNLPPMDFNGDGVADVIRKMADLYENPNGGQEICQPDDPDCEPLFLTNYYWQVATLLKQPDATGNYSDELAFEILFEFDPLLDDVGGLYVGDINGDGLTDILVPPIGSSSSSYQYHLSTGNELTVATPLQFDTAGGITSLQITDVDKNGEGDIVYFSKAQKRWMQLLRKNGEYQPATELYTESSYDENTDSVFMADWNGDGDIGLGRFEQDGATLKLHYRRDSVIDAPAQRIRTITDGFDRITDLSYVKMTDTSVYTKGSDAQNKRYGLCQFDASLNPSSDCSPVFDLVSPGYLVYRVSSSAPGYVNGSYQANKKLSVRYHYQGMRAQSGGRGLLGFEKIFTYDIDRDITTETEYHQDFPYIGMPVQSTQYMGEQSANPPANQLLSQATNTYQAHWLHNNSVVYPYLQQSTETQYAVNDPVTGDTVSGTEIYQTLALSVTQTTNTYTAVDDNHANLTQAIVETRTASNSLVSRVTTDNEYAIDDGLNKWWLGRLTRSDVTHHRPNATPSTTVNRATAFTYNTSGLLETETLAPEGNANLKLVTRHCYDALGNKTAVIQADGSLTSCAKQSPNTTASLTDLYRYQGTLYDADRRYVTATQSTLADDLLTISTRDAWGQVTRSTDINSVITDIGYDHFGRQFATANSIGQASTQIQRLAANAASISAPAISEAYHFVQRTESAGQPTSYTYYDLMGREVGRAVQGFNGSYILQTTRYDVYGRVIAQSNPQYSGEVVYSSTSVYDKFGRVQSMAAADAITRTRTEYSLDGLSVTNTVTSDFGVSQSQTEHSNVLGETTKVTDANNSDIVYFYDPTGNLSKVDNQSNATTTSLVTGYDAYGRKTSISDPDKGNWSYAYNALGELISQTDANNATTQFYRDSEGRTVKRVLNGETTLYEYAGHQLEAECFSNGVDCTTSVGFAKSYVYDDFGRLDTQITQMNGTPYMEYTTYDQYGRVFQQFDASGNNFGVRHFYNAYGYLQKQEEARYSNSNNEQLRKIFYEVVKMDAFGNVTEFKQNDGKVETERNHDAQTGYLTGISAKSIGFNIQANTLTFDGIGNLRRRTRSALANTASVEVNGETYNIHAQEFSYDVLNRLTHINNDEEASYQNNGNIHWKRGVGYYCYNPARPHAVSGIGSANCTTESYTYDANGNMLDGRGNVFTYSDFDKPLTISNSQGGTTFAYGTNRSRYKRATTENGQTTETWYVGNVEFVYQDGALSETRRYLPNAIQNRFATGATQTQYLHKDHLGSVDSVTNEDGELLDKLYFDAWGNKVSIHYDQWSLQAQSAKATTLVNLLNLTPRGFTGHEHIDHANIIHMNGRIYDPTLGRFLQADPFIQAPKNSQSYNRYSYVLNNPLSYTDPSGFFFSKLWKGIKKFAGVIVAAVVAVYCQACSIWVLGSIQGGVDALVNGGNIFKGAVLGAFTAGIPGSNWYRNLNAIGRYAVDRVLRRAEASLDRNTSENSQESRAQQVVQANIVAGSDTDITGGKFANSGRSSSLAKIYGESQSSIRKNFSKFLDVVSPVLQGLGGAGQLVGGLGLCFTTFVGCAPGLLIAGHGIANLLQAFGVTDENYARKLWVHLMGEQRGKTAFYSVEIGSAIFGAYQGIRTLNHLKKVRSTASVNYSPNINNAFEKASIRFAEDYAAKFKISSAASLATVDAINLGVSLRGEEKNE